MMELKKFFLYLRSLFQWFWNREEISVFVLMYIGFSYAVRLFKIDQQLYGFMVFLATAGICRVWEKYREQTKIRELTEEALEQPDNLVELNIDKKEGKLLLPGLTLSKNLWLMDALQKAWPTYLSELIQNEINKPYTTFDKRTYVTGKKKIVEFGSFLINKDYAPGFDDIKVTDEAVRTDEVLISAYVSMSGNIGLLVKTVKERLVLKDVKFRDYFKFVFRPFVDQSPFVGGFAFWLPGKPVMDYTFTPKIKTHFAGDEDLEKFQDFLIENVAGHFISPNKVCIQLGEHNSIQTSQKLKFPIPVALALLQVIEASNLLRTHREIRPYCVIRIGDYKLITKPKPGSGHHSPLFDEVLWAVVHDYYDHCEIQVYNSTKSGELFAGSVKFSFRNSAFSTKEKSENDINGTDIWLPLEGVPQGMLHLKLTLFTLSPEESAIKKALTQLQAFELDKYKFVAVVVSVFVKSATIIGAQGTRKTRDKNYHYVQVGYENMLRQTRAVFGENGVFTWDEGFHFLVDTNPLDQGKEINFVVLEYTRKSEGTRHVKTAGSMKVLIAEILTKCKAGMNYYEQIDLLRDGFYDASSCAKLGVFIAIRAIEVVNDVMQKLCSPPEVRAIAVERETTTSCSACVDWLQFMVSEQGEAVDNVKHEDLPAFSDIEKNACRIKLVFRLASRTVLVVEVIRVINVPVFDSPEPPMCSVMIELWRSNTKVDQKKTSYRGKSRNPLFGRRFRFTIVDGNLQRHLIRIVVTSRTGWIKRKVSLVAEAFIGIPPLETDGAVVAQWFKLFPIGLDVGS